MSTGSPWPVIHAECGALADDLDALTADQWSTASLCAGWSAHEVLGRSHGSGPEMRGPMMALLLAMTGRGGALADLSGDDVDTLTGRLPA